MINTQKVNENLCAISGMSQEEAASYAIIVNNSTGAVEHALIDSSFESDDRIVYLAAARAYYNITLTGSGEDSISEFAAGDVKIRIDKSTSDSALALYRNAAQAAAGMVQDDGFVFRGV